MDFSQGGCYKETSEDISRCEIIWLSVRREREWVRVIETETEVETDTERTRKVCKKSICSERERERSGVEADGQQKKMDCLNDKSIWTGIDR